MKTGFDDQFIQWSIIKSIICYVGTMIRFLLVMLFLMSKVRVHSFRSCPKPGMVHWRSFVPFSSHQRCFRTATTLHLNRVLVDISECSVVSESGDGDGLLVAELNSTDYRYDHINKVTSSYQLSTCLYTDSPRIYEIDSEITTRTTVSIRNSQCRND